MFPIFFERLSSESVTVIVSPGVVAINIYGIIPHSVLRIQTNQRIIILVSISYNWYNPDNYF